MRVHGFVFLICFFLGSVSAFGQEGSKLGFRFGSSHTQYYGSDIDTILVRVNESNQTITGKQESRTSLMAGIYVNTELKKYFWLKHEFYWANKGATINFEDGSTLSRRRMYIDLYPVLLTFHVKGFQLFAGPYMAVLFLKNDELKTSTGEKITNKDAFTDIGADNFFDFGAVAGLEYEFGFGLNLGVRYFRGFAFDDNSYQVNLHNEGIYASIGFTISTNN